MHVDGASTGEGALRRRQGLTSGQRPPSASRRARSRRPRCGNASSTMTMRVAHLPTTLTSRKVGAVEPRRWAGRSRTTETVAVYDELLSSPCLTEFSELEWYYCLGCHPDVSNFVNSTTKVLRVCQSFASACVPAAAPSRPSARRLTRRRTTAWRVLSRAIQARGRRRHLQELRAAAGFDGEQHQSARRAAPLAPHSARSQRSPARPCVMRAGIAFSGASDFFGTLKPPFFSECVRRGACPSALGPAPHHPSPPRAATPWRW